MFGVILSLSLLSFVTEAFAVSAVVKDAFLKALAFNCPRYSREIRRFDENPPPRTMPEDLQPLYTQDGNIPTSDFYIDDTMGGRGSHYVYDEPAFSHFVNFGQNLRKLSRVGKILRGKHGLGKVAVALDAVEDKINGGKVIVYGSMRPSFEGLALAYGASQVVTVEHNNLTYIHPKVRTVRVRDFELEAEREDEVELFDIGMSISSFDHSGLGRYGDPLEPDGDLRAMDEARKRMAPDGIFILTVPIGKDHVAWNLHRRYGALRLPRLLAGWEVIDVIGWNEGGEEWEGTGIGDSYEPVFVLKPNKHLQCEPGSEEL